MSERRKNRIDLIEEKFEDMKKKRWAKGVRITSGVVWNLFLLFLIFGLTLSVFAASVGAGYFASLVAKEPLRTKQEMRSEIFNYEETSEIFFADNKYLGKVSSDIERRETKLKDVSPYLIDAVFATEDEYFMTHNGIVPKAIFRGLLQDVTNSDSQTGGSTLTQQLIKNQILTNEVSYERKAKEILLAMRLEHFMNKEEILEAYLNIIPYGRNVHGDNIAGIETAAEGIFGLNAKDLNLAQAAYIAGIPQAPFAYTPFKSGKYGGGVKSDEALKPGIDRMKTVLFRMKETGYITKQEYEKAIAYDITKDLRTDKDRPTSRYPYLTQEIQKRTTDILVEVLAKRDDIELERLEQNQKLKEKYLILAEREMKTGGYRIYSTIDQTLYDKMNEVAKNFEHYGFTYTREEKDSETGEMVLVDDPVQVGSILIENKTGRILSFIGGLDDKPSYNFATQGHRQNGSSIKPLLVYAPAIEYGVIGAGSPVVDLKIDTPNWKVSNYFAEQEDGILPAREALARSLNLPTARLYEEIRDRRPMEFLEKMNFKKLTEADYVNQSASLGALTVGASVEENTNAFATFANGGQFIPSYMIERIEDAQGNVIFEHKSEPVEVFSPETAYIITDMLRDVVKPGGTGQQVPKNLNFSLDLAAKTGTTQGYGDAWLVGYNPNVSLGIWLGYKDQTRKLYSRGSSQLHPTTRTSMLFGRLMNTANAARPDIVGAGAKFKQPAGVVTRSFCGISGLAPSNACSAAGLVRSDLFNSKVMVPTKPDDSIISASYVSVKGVKYLALPSTPSEFIVSGGTGVNEEFIKRMLGPFGGDGSKLFSGKSIFASNVVSGSVFNADGANPAGVQASANGSTITWTESASNDVIGYYVYRDNERVATIRDSSSNSYSAGPGSYYVRAVDITGLLSPGSNIVTIGSPEPPADTGEDDSEGDHENPTPKPPAENENPGSGQNNGNSGDPNDNKGNNGNNNGNGNGNNNGNGSGNGNGHGNNGKNPPPKDEEDDR
ncbi:transglycosylase domain-containing protein [Sporosarcina cyprini]|uniref:transglycosylase domain-containing protein n=1 Tax=Sporosarcina cyprini TaxID=2910523 RepID=UPI001EE01F6C|nr:transglycosylase domain-containing protein [Sporosarcina cyprini]MCG3089435.1 penicillin-binding protein [Sporosarcina cyprini]